MSLADTPSSLPTPEEEAALLAALEAALGRGELSPADNERLLALALEDPLAPPTSQELAAAAQLRDALARAAPHGDLATLRALSAAFEPGEQVVAQSAVEAAVRAALPAPRPRGNVVYALFGAASVAVAAAAGVLLLIGAERSELAPSTRESTLLRTRSSAALFSERFEVGATTARIDVIARERGRDLRDNRFAAWGVR